MHLQHTWLPGAGFSEKRTFVNLKLTYFRIPTTTSLPCRTIILSYSLSINSFHSGFLDNSSNELTHPYDWTKTKSTERIP